MYALISLMQTLTYANNIFDLITWDWFFSIFVTVLSNILIICHCENMTTFEISAGKKKKMGVYNRYE